LAGPELTGPEQGLESTTFDLLAKGRRPKTKIMPGAQGAHPLDRCTE
jgi:hypothetical protein